ncbi:MAG: 1,6-anhydro-N-acetylmuramyl-L-alanine amidase AmpD [Woeseiaceae bacterium]|nr:1,6-anhydro-N-acetylmuramyl-L-alanine amidase AmpD [Woeseiaceae bacterium]
MAQAFTIDAAHGRIEPAAAVPSPNCDARPAGAEPELIVVHGISLPPGEFGGSGIVDLFTNRLDWDAHPYYAGIRGLQVSSHLLIRRDGALTQFVPFTERAWHAGPSWFRDRDCCNDFSIGIELEGTDDMPYEDPQYAVLAGVIRALIAAYPRLSARRIAAHSDIAPGRKTDPGPAFDWRRLYDGLRGDGATEAARRA